MYITKKQNDAPFIWIKRNTHPEFISFIILVIDQNAKTIFGHVMYRWNKSRNDLNY